jgi:hypothetical protein
MTSISRGRESDVSVLQRHLLFSRQPDLGRQIGRNSNEKARRLLLLLASSLFCIFLWKYYLTPDIITLCKHIFTIDNDRSTSRLWNMSRLGTNIVRDLNISLIQLYTVATGAIQKTLIWFKLLNHSMKLNRIHDPAFEKFSSFFAFVLLIAGVVLWISWCRKKSHASSITIYVIFLSSAIHIWNIPINVTHVHI